MSLVVGRGYLGSCAGQRGCQEKFKENFFGLKGWHDKGRLNREPEALLMVALLGWFRVSGLKDSKGLSSQLRTSLLCILKEQLFSTPGLRACSESDVCIEVSIR